MNKNFDVLVSDLQAIQKAVSTMPFYELDDDLREYVVRLSISVNDKIAKSAPFSTEEMHFIREAIAFAIDALQDEIDLDQELKDGLSPFLFTFNSLSDRLDTSLD